MMTLAIALSIFSVLCILLVLRAEREVLRLEKTEARLRKLLSSLDDVIESNYACMEQAISVLEGES